MSTVRSYFLGKVIIQHINAEYQFCFTFNNNNNNNNFIETRLQDTIVK